MEEIFELIKAFNRLKDRIIEISGKIDLLLKSHHEGLESKYVDEALACKILHVCPRVLAQMRANGSIPFIKHHRKILYLESNLHEYLEKNIKR